MKGDWVDRHEYRCSFCKSNKPMDDWVTCRACMIFWSVAVGFAVIFSCGSILLRIVL